MSLVILRSWADGQPPKVRAIAPPDSDKDEVVIPDNNGRFVTTEVNKRKENGIGSGGGGVSPGSEKNQKVTGQPPPPVVQPRSSYHSFGSVSNRSSITSSSSSPSPPVPELRTKSGQVWTNSFNRSEKAKTLPHDLSKLEPLPLSRESSINSEMTDSPPSSPICGSRYKNLGPELAATIPRRQIIRETWIKESHSNFKKKEMSKSTPALNISPEQEDSQEEPTQHHHHHQLRSTYNKTQNPGKYSKNKPSLAPPRPISYSDTYDSDSDQKIQDRSISITPQPISYIDTYESEGDHKVKDRPTSITPRPISFIDTFYGSNGDLKVGDSPILPQPIDPYESKRNPKFEDRPSTITTRPVSYIDTFYGSDGEPKFGDRPASVVQVFKKDPLIGQSSIGTNQHLTQSQKKQVPGVDAEKNEDLNSILNSEISNSIPSCASLELKLANPNLSKKFRATRSYSSEIHRESLINSTNPKLVSDPKDSLPTLPSNITPPPVFRTQLQLPLLSSSTPAAAVEFPVHKVTHSDKTSPPLPLIGPVELEQKTSSLNSSAKVNENEQYLFSISTNPKSLNSERKSRDENEEIDLELEALRDNSSRSTTTTAEARTPFVDSPDNNGLISIQSDCEMSTTCSSSAASSPQFFFNDPRQQRIIPNQITASNEKQRSSNNGKIKFNHGSAWVQVPVQCINRHVFLPDQEHQPNNHAQRQPNNHVQPLEPPPRHLNNTHNQNNVYKTNQRRKNFCDDLLNDVIIQIPQHVRPRIPPSTSPPIQPQNHDGIIIFDEEEEDEMVLIDSETESSGGAASEREKSVDYISVFHNVQVGSINDLLQSQSGYKSINPELTRIIGLDLGSVTTRYASFDKITNYIKLGEGGRTMTTSDGQKHGSEVIPHAIATKCKIIYKWKAKQSFPYDPYDDEDCATTLETLLRHYRHLLTSSSPQSERKERQENGTQWNLGIHSGMDKKLVREAALNCGLMKPNDELRLVNESTAAAVMAFQFLQRQTHPPHTWGKTYLSVNIGATFIHTSGYELKGSKLHVIESSDSQLYESPESNLIELFSRIFSREFILKYESSFQPSWIKILSQFDEMKDLFYKCHAECFLFLPVSFYLEYTKFTGMNIPECLEDNIEEGVRWDKNGAIRFNQDLMKDWLQPTINFIKTRFKIKTYDSIVLSGGGANQFIANELNRLLPFVNVYTLPDPEKAVVEGLVRIDSATVTLKSPFSIGVGVMTPFDESIHPKEKCVTRQGKKWCSDVWDTLIRKGQPLTIGQAVLKRSYVGAQPGQNILVLPIFKSDLDEPKLVTSPSVEKCCELRFEINKEKAWREVQLVIKCYESELTIMTSGNDGEVNQVVIDF